MEVVLHESTYGANGKSGCKNSVNGDNKEQECTYKNGYTFNASSQRLPVDIQFENITFTATEGTIFNRSKKEILHGVNGRFPPGQLIAIMGPSGAGKSTLLDVLSGYRINGIGGIVSTNGRERNFKQFRKISCYITQEDRLQPLLTVEESMHIAADVKLPSTVSSKEKQSIIDHILSTLRLLETKKTKVARLSGGQKKRMSIALELISDPLVMFLDEPTTGLDSSSCMTCIRLLKDLAKEGRTIVCTIHQPSASLFELFDQVYVVASGNCLYQGSTGNLVPFLENVGSPCPMYHNPADYVIEIASGEYGDELLTTMINATSNGRSSEFFNDPQKLPNMRIQKDEFAKEDKQNSLLATSQFNQLKVLLRRGYIKAKRDTTLTFLRIGVNALVGLMLGTVYWKAGSDGSKVLDNYNLLFSLLMHHMMSTMMLTILTFPSELAILIKEHFNRWYTLKMYYLSTTLVDIPLSVFCTFIFTVILYWMTDQPSELYRFFMFFITSTLTVFVAQSFGLMIGAYFNVVNGTFLGPTLSVPMMMFAGFGVRLRDLPSYLYWGCYISYLRFSLEGLVGAVYGHRKPLECPEEVDICLFRDPNEFLKEVGVPGDQFDNDVIALLLFVFVLRIAAFVMLKCKLLAVRS